ncbi:hypothetical protein P879_01237 [Paragonimus westermani]|uniref:Uncharacterized protein n=1 Tax=Paragonimus westermani TaxID=34504 RepID=A0A8T0DV13_9TREM|nr:hypothetical protein P879_01237 [Paragonimus westermani]
MEIPTEDLNESCALPKRDSPWKQHPTVRIALPNKSDEVVYVKSVQEQKPLLYDARITARRTSLHGKPLPLRQCRTDVRYRRLQAKVYNFLERPKTWRSMTYHAVV